MPRFVHRAPHRGHVAGHTRGSLVVDHHHGFDVVVPILGELRADRRGIDSVTPVAGKVIDHSPRLRATLVQRVEKWPVS